MFQFAGLPLSRIPSRYAGSPIRISRYHRSCAPPPGFSQLSTSFFGSRRLGILRVPFPSFSSLNLSFLQLLLFYLLFISHCPSFLGGDKRVRTADLCLARAALSQLSYIPKTLSIMVGMAGLEPATPALSAQCSNHLSYTPIRYIKKQCLYSLERR